MTQDKNRSRTEMAWTRLYDRLHTDGLLPEEPKADSPFRLKPSPYGWAAAVVILCLTLGTYFLMKPGGDASSQTLLTLQNNMGAVTMATTLEDGSIIYLADNSKLNYPSRFEEKVREVHLTGDALFDVSGNKERPFVIDTKDITIEVLGTSFYIKNNERTPFELAVRHGLVKVKNKKNKRETLVKAGETARLLSGELQISQATDNAVFKDYMQKVYFKDELLANILRVVNKEYGESLIQTSPELGQRLSLTVTFTHNSPESFAHLISTALKLTYKKENDIILITDMDHTD